MVYQKGHPFYPGGEKCWFKKGHVPWIKGRSHSLETRIKISSNKERSEKISKRLTGRKLSEEHKKKVSLALIGNSNAKGAKRPEEFRKRLSILHIGKKLKPGIKEKIRVSHLGKKLTEECKKNISLAFTNDRKKKMSARMLELWKDKEYKERVIKNTLKSLLRRPTSLEKLFLEFCKKYKLPFMYCGDGSLLVGSKNPDFVESNGKKLCVEIAHRFFKHHQPNDEYERRRKEHFAKYGWKCLVIWNNEFFEDKRKLKSSWEQQLLDKINDFTAN